MNHSSRTPRPRRGAPIDLSRIPHSAQRKIVSCFSNLRRTGSIHDDRRVETFGGYCPDGLVAMKADRDWRVLGWKVGTHPDADARFPEAIVAGVLWIEAMSHETYNRTFRTFTRTRPSLPKTKAKAPTPDPTPEPPAEKVVISNKAFKDDPGLISTTEAGDLLGKGVSSIHRLLDAGKLTDGPKYSIKGPYDGRSIRVDEKLMALIEETQASEAASASQAVPEAPEIFPTASGSEEHTDATEATPGPPADLFTNGRALTGDFEQDFPDFKVGDPAVVREALTRLAQEEADAFVQRVSLAAKVEEQKRLLARAEEKYDAALSHFEAIEGLRITLYTKLV